MPKLLIMAGGTGGHIFPGLAVAQMLRGAKWDIEWLGTANKMEAQIVPQHDILLHTIAIKGVRGNGLVGKLLLPWTLTKAVYQAYKIVSLTKPDVILGMGGYASGPGGIAAWLHRIPLIVHEQNAIAGMTNRYLARLATHTLTGFNHTDFGSSTINQQVRWVGNPIRSDISAISASLPHQDNINILVVGGSLGARALNQSLPSVFSRLAKKLNHSDTSPYNMTITHQVGKGNQATVTDEYNKHILADNVSINVREFIDDMASDLAAADIVICRAGALTVAEVSGAGRAACFVPLPSAVDDHQTKNAQSLSEHNAAMLCPQGQLGQLDDMLIKLITDQDLRIDMAQQAKSLSQGQATETVCKIITDTLTGTKNSGQSPTKIAVLLGGTSAERKVSLASGNAVVNAIASLGLPVIAFDPKLRSLSELVEEQVTHVMIMLHGRGGEDGTVQGALEWMNIPYTGTGVLGSAIAMDKLHTKHVWQALGLPTAKYLEIDHPLSLQSAQTVMQQVGQCVMVKPSHEGSSIGMAKVDTPAGLVAAIDVALRYDKRVLVEQFICGPEYTVSILAGVALPSISMATPHSFYDYEAKYQANTTQYFCPSDLSSEDEQIIGQLSLDAFSAVSCQGWGRVDLMRDAVTGEFVLLEVNTVPGMTQTSLVPKAALQAGYSFNDLVKAILVDAFSPAILHGVAVADKPEVT